MTDEAIDGEEVDVADEAIEQEAAPKGEVAPKREWSDEDESEAKALGWKSPDEWAGEKPDGYIDDPRRYLERAENFRPFKSLKERAERAEREADERLRKLEAVTKAALESQRRQYETSLADIKAKKLVAVDHGDTEEYKRLDQQEAQLAAVEVPKEESRDDTQDRSEVDRYVAEYGKTNPWVSNPILRDAGAKLVDARLKSGPMSLGDQLSYAEAELRKIYPAYFAPVAESQKQPSPQRVDGGGLGSAGKGSGFSKLPAEAREAFKRFVAEGLFDDTEADRKRYTDEYDAA